MYSKMINVYAVIGIIIISILISYVRKRYFKKQKHSYDKIHNKQHKYREAIVTQYRPPQNQETSYLFYLWSYNKDSYNKERLFTALIYYWMMQGWINLKKNERNNHISIQEVSTSLSGGSIIDHSLLHNFFGVGDDFHQGEKYLNSIVIQGYYTGMKIHLLINALQGQVYKTKLLEHKSNRFGSKIYLSKQGEDIIHHLKGYKEYISKVEQPVIENELKSDPNFINTILPWAILFGVDTRLLSIINNISSIQLTESYNSNIINSKTISSMIQDTFYHIKNHYNTSATYNTKNTKALTNFISLGISGFGKLGGLSGGGRGGGGGGSR